MASGLTCYYSEDISDPSLNIFEPAQTAFDEALQSFKQRPTSVSRNGSFALEGTTLRDILDAVSTMQKRYENERSRSKTRRCLTNLSKRIYHYGNIMDVLVQHHPEYVSLAWGAMKFIFGAFVEHENLGRIMVTGLCDIADALPRVELAAFLYPTNTMKHTVSVLYAHIIKFLVRASKWYEEGKLARALHSITRPAALRYDDLLSDIRSATRGVAELAISSSQAEQRAMHHEVQALALQVKEFRKDVLLDQSVKFAKLLECQNTMSEIQNMQAITLVSAACSVDYRASFQASLLIRNKHPLSIAKSNSTPFCLSSGTDTWNTETWNTPESSAAVTIRAPLKDHVSISNLCVNLIEQLRNADVSVLWILKPRQKTQISVIEVLKSLIHQALSLDHASSTDSKMAFLPRQFLDAHVEGEYVTVLGSILEHIKLVYIIVEAGAMSPADAPQCELHLHILSQRLSDRGAATVLKVMILTCGPYSSALNESKTLVWHFGQSPSRDLALSASTPRLRLSKGNLIPTVRIRGRPTRFLGPIKKSQ